MISLWAVSLLLFAPAADPIAPPAWRSLPMARPDGERAHTGSHIVKPGTKTAWMKPPFVPNVAAASGRKRAKVVVVSYNPVLETQGGKRLFEWVKGTNPEEASHILADVVREASWGYINYEIVDVITIDGYPAKVDGFRYDDTTYLAARQTKKWQPATTSYRKVLEENGLVDRCRREGITEIWLWGADGFHIDEFAGFIPNRYARFAPTDNPWFYRPYDIPDDLGQTTWVMGFNVEVGPDNMIHSYTHRVESMAALAVADGAWDPKRLRDPWNVFSFLELDHPGQASQVGNCHVPPNGKAGYDYNNPRRVLSFAERWAFYPDLRGDPLPISSSAWGHTQFGYQKWILEHIPKFPGHTAFGYNNWWLYIANVDEELPAFRAPDPGTFVPPARMPAVLGGKP